MTAGQAPGGQSFTEIREGIPHQASALFGRLRPPGRVAALVAEQFEAGRQAASTGFADAGAPIASDDPADAAAVAADVARQRAVIRRDALMACLPENRADCVQGLAVLFPDQQPDKLQAWLDDPTARTLLLTGRTGNGKTQAAFATAAQAARYGAMRAGRDGVARRRPALVRGFDAEAYLTALRPDGAPEPAWLTRRRAQDADLLIIDDLGAEMDQMPTEFVRTQMASLLNARLENCARTIFTTNVARDTLKENLGSRFWSRLQEHSTVLSFNGPDRRVVRELSW